jgi:hypothetical protein
MKLTKRALVAYYGTWAGLLAMISCTAASRSASQDEGVSMNDRLRAFSTHPSLEVVIVLGTEHFDNGQFTVRVKGKGSAEVVQRRAGDTRQFTRTLDAAALDAFGRTLADNEFTLARTSTMPREPGDTPVLLQLLDGGTSQFEVELWEADRYEDKRLAAILQAAEALIKSMVGDDGYP